jgi:hypothetical protein
MEYFPFDCTSNIHLPSQRLHSQFLHPIFISKAFHAFMSQNARLLRDALNKSGADLNVRCGNINLYKATIYLADNCELKWSQEIIIFDYGDAEL